MRDEITIRRAKGEDLDDIICMTAKLYEGERNLYGSDWDVDWVSRKGAPIIKNAIEDKDSFVAVAQDGGRAIAFLRGSLYWADWMSWKKGEGAELWDIFIEKEYRRKNIGSRLMAMYLEWCKQNKIDYILINVTAANTGALAFYREFGFEVSQKIMEKKIH